MKITIEIIRDEFNKEAIIGKLKILERGNENALFSCYTLENPKVGAERGQDLAIPFGSYGCRWYNSPRFKQELLHIFNDIVPKDRYILIHAGNKEKDTEGCILLGKTRINDSTIGVSRDAVREFNEIIKKYDTKDIVILIKKGENNDKRS